MGNPAQWRVCVLGVRTPVSQGARRRPGRPIAAQRPSEALGSFQGREQSRAEARGAASRRDWRVRLCGVRPRRLLRALGPKSGLIAVFGVLEAALRLPRRLHAAQAAQSTLRLLLASLRTANQH